MLKSLAAIAVTACTVGAVTLPQTPKQDFWTWWNEHYDGNDSVKVTIIGKAGSGKTRLAKKLLELQTGINPDSFLRTKEDRDHWFLDISDYSSDVILESTSLEDRVARLRDTDGCLINIHQANRQADCLDRSKTYSWYDARYSEEIINSHVVLVTYRKNGKLMVRVTKSRFGPQPMAELVLA